MEGLGLVKRDATELVVKLQNRKRCIEEEVNTLMNRKRFVHVRPMRDRLETKKDCTVESSVSPLDRASQWNSPSTGDLLQRYNLDSEPDFSYLRNIMENQSVADNLFN